MSSGKNIRYLLGSNTKRGFVPLFDELRNPQDGKKLYIIKGGPGSGKSSLMKRIIKVQVERNHDMEYIHCSSDPKSLDGFIDHDAGIAMVDGTAPHIMDPRFPGAYDNIINMADCWDSEHLVKNKHKIISLNEAISSCHNMATSYIKAAAALLDSNIKSAKAYINHNSVNTFVTDLIKKLYGSKTGKEKKRLLSAVSVGETVFFADTITELASTIYVLQDNWGAASSLILSRINNVAEYLGFERIVCYCSIRTPDKIDHIIFPDAGIAVTTYNDFHKFRGSSQIIDGIMASVPESLDEQMNINLKNAKELINHATNQVKQAKILHDDLEAIYIEAMDFSKVDIIFDKIIAEIT